MGARIVILVHEMDRSAAQGYLVQIMGEIWKRHGLEVTVHRGPNNPPRGDVAILHIDLTRIPDVYLEAAQAYPRVINGGVRDIAKRAITRQRVLRGDGYDGPVMVKTNLNYGGGPEAHLARKGPFYRKWASKVRRKLPWYLRGELKNYPVLDSPKDVPAAAWLNPDLIVERFLSEREGDFYCLRTWMFLGEAETNSVSFSHHEQVKSTNLVGRRNEPEIPEDLRALRRELQFDYGKFDYALVDGKAVLYDANRTPTAGGIDPELIRSRMEVLASGLKDFL